MRKILLLRVNRHPKEFEIALVQRHPLRDIRSVLEKQDSDYSRKLGTNKVFVFPDEYSVAMEASRKKKLKGQHVIVSELLVSLVRDVIGELPHKANVRVMDEQIIAYLVPGRGGAVALPVITRAAGFLPTIICPLCTEDDSRTAVTDPVH